MKKHLFRAVSLMLLAALCLTLFAGCSPRKATIFTVNGDDVCYDDIMVHLFFQKYDLFSSQISNGTMTFDNLYDLDVDMLSKELSDGVTLSDYLLLTATNTALSAQLCRQLAKENKLKSPPPTRKPLKPRVSSSFRRSAAPRASTPSSRSPAQRTAPIRAISKIRCICPSF